MRSRTAHAQRPSAEPDTELLSPATQIVGDKDVYLGNAHQRHRPAHRRRPARTVRGLPPGRGHAAAVRAAGARLHRHPRHRHAASSARLLAAVAAASSRKLQKLVIRRQGYGVALATLQFVELPLQAGPQLARLHHADRRRHPDAPSAGAGAAGAQPAGGGDGRRPAAACAGQQPAAAARGHRHRALAEPAAADGAAGVGRDAAVPGRRAGRPQRRDGAHHAAGGPAGGCLVLHQRHLEPAEQQHRPKRRPHGPCPARPSLPRLLRDRQTPGIRTAADGPVLCADPAAGAEPDARHRHPARQRRKAPAAPRCGTTMSSAAPPSRAWSSAACSTSTCSAHWPIPAPSAWPTAWPPRARCCMR